MAGGALPPLAERLPQVPAVTRMDERGRAPGRYGGDLRMLIAKAQDVRLLSVWGYARLVRWNAAYELEPDILQAVEVAEGRRFTLRLRSGHRWSDGRPFTSDDFRYWWEDVANNADLSPKGPPRSLLVEGKPPRVSFPDATTVVYEWDRPNPHFLPQLAQARPLVIFLPAHYLRAFHSRYAEDSVLKPLIVAAGVRNWAGLHNLRETLRDCDNPEMPTLDPWVNTSRPPATRFVATRNPFFHRVDEQGRQLPYIDRVILLQSDTRLVAAKAAAGDADLQARGIAFSNYTFLKQGTVNGRYGVRLWRVGIGNQVALFPNLNVADPVWRNLVRDVRFRHALSLGIDRHLINEALYFGLATEGNNTVLRDSPLYADDLRTRWADYNPDEANRLLDQLGLTRRNEEGIRLLPDGRPAEIIVETAGEDMEQGDVLELVAETWREIGLKLFTKPSQREVMRTRIYAGQALMTVWTGMDNAVATPDMAPTELAPVSQDGLMWPKWGQYYETMGQAGEPIDLPAAKELFDLYRGWMGSTDMAVRRGIWNRMLEIQAEQTFSIGTVAGVLQPVVVASTLRNVPDEAVWAWDPGGQLGIMHPEGFWFDGGTASTQAASPAPGSGG
ncbi:ABC transporter substrate-binding protein [Zavarzinia sp. CC-PAN008]|uniref:ABC transporter substrate-binding protein n=1 Tax=Zavarzinia sp. CC-PAN008 TaxID=3243332 RepID=UPI003F7478B6